MPELRPPDMMPNGNVGTPTLVFLDLIQKCLLPKSIISKLCLKFPSTNAKRLYSNVNLDYGTDETDSQGVRMEKEKNRFTMPGVFPKKSNKILRNSLKFIGESSELSSSKSIPSQTLETPGRIISHIPSSDKKSLSDVPSPTLSSSSFSIVSIANQNHASSSESDSPNNFIPKAVTGREKKRLEKEERRRTKALMNEGIEERLICIERRYHNDEDAEEWDRHEATEDDPSNQERNKERLYEDEIEQPWEKGGPGVVFYTDAMYWQAKEGDFDEQTTDDLDVDFTPYEGDGPGDMDIRDFLKIRQEKRFRDGYDKTDRFSIGLSKKPDLVPVTSPTGLSMMSGGKPTDVQGKFEHHTKGIGRKLMEKQGWQEGQGLGKSESGIVEALRGDGQRPYDKKGLGFVESEPVRYGPSVLKKARIHRLPVPHHITTSNDDPRITDPKEPLLQRNEPTILKHRQSFLDHHESSL